MNFAAFYVKKLRENWISKMSDLFLIRIHLWLPLKSTETTIVVFGYTWILAM